MEGTQVRAAHAGWRDYLELCKPRVVLLMLLPSTVTARPRFLYTAFPLLISAAAWFELKDRRDWWPYVVGGCCAGLVGLTALYGVLGAIP